MSLTRPSTGSKNPAKKYLKFSGRRYVAPADPDEAKDDIKQNKGPRQTDGKFYYYDKQKEENIPLEEMPPFIVLDGYGFEGNLFSVSGWIESYRAFAWSNEVRKHDDVVVVRLFDKPKTELAKGPYSDIAPEIKDLGCKYTKSLYVMFSGEKEICHIALQGGAMSSWLEIEGHDDKFQSQYVIVKDISKGTKGDTKFYKVEFDFGDEFSEEDLENAKALDSELQEYLDKYLKKDPGETPVYDKDDTNTDSWAFIDAGLGDDRELKDLSIDELNEIREDLESKNEEDGTFYQFVCRACKENKNKKTETKSEDKPKRDLTSLLKKPKKDEQNEEWKKFKMPKGSDVEFLGDMEYDDIKELRKQLELDEDLKKDYSDLYDAIIASTIPF
jgi:hypothetical protein